MSLRSRFALAFALVGAVVALLVGVLSYHAASERIYTEIDRSLGTTTTALAGGDTGVLASTAPGPPERGGPPGPKGDDAEGYGRGPGRSLVGISLSADGSATFLGGRPVTLPVTEADRALTTTRTAGLTYTTEVTLGRDVYRVLTTARGDGAGALQVATDVDDVQRVLHGMAIEIAWVSGLVLLGAAGAGWLVARRITHRLTRLAGIAEQVSGYGGVEREVPVDGRDEVGRLSASFNTMLARLAAARESQERLVQDAAHELRTPLTSLRTNASVLARVGELSPQARERLVADMQGETRELSTLVDELVELALARREQEPEETVALAGLADRVARRARRRTGREVRVDADDGVVHGRRQALERAVGNLLENAAKFDPDGAEPIELTVRRGTVTVRDRGPGIDAADTARVFDRFYRADAARGFPGSGLGLAIVRDVAEDHGGTVFASTSAGGGAAVGFTVAAGRLLPSSESGHAGTSPGSSTVGGT